MFSIANSAHGLTIGAPAAQLLIYVKQLKETRSSGCPDRATLHPSSLDDSATRARSAFPKQERHSL